MTYKINIPYRPDIDGLRAISVLLVIFFHFNIPGFSAGYIGVDIFFVISGFLITSIIAEELSADHFSIFNFYERRIRRIFPMLFFISIVFLIAGYVFFESITYKNLAGSIATSSMFFSNIFFLRTSPDYFALATTSFKPFLHTWSLSVEEQFYIIFPLLLAFLYKVSRRSLFIYLSSCLVLSLILYIFVAKSYPLYAFFLSPTRAWEFLVGSCIAVGLSKKGIRQSLAGPLQLAGAACLMANLIFFKPVGVASVSGTIISVLGAGLLIGGGVTRSGWIYRLLSLKPVVFTGKISYSLYLWHFPVYIFAGYLLNEALFTFEKAALLVLVTLLSVLSFYFVERPFRIKTIADRKGRYVFLMAAVLVVTIGGTSFWIYWKDGLPNRYLENAALHEANFSPELQHWRSVTINSAARLSAGQPPVSIGDKSGQPSFLLWGDSHAIAIAPGVDYISKQMKKKGYVVARNSTAPLAGLTRQNDPEFTSYMQHVLDFIGQHPEIKTIILVARWKSYLSMDLEPVEKKRGPKQRGRDNTALRNGLLTTVKIIRSLKRQVVIVNELPEVKYDMRWFTANKIRNKFFNKGEINIAQTLDEYRSDSKRQRTAAIFKQLEKDFQVTILHCENKLLEGDQFVFVKNGHFIYSDAHHLSAFGAKYISGDFEKVFR